MKVFVTGGTGYVGTVLVEHLVNAGHAVTGLARSVPGAEALTAAGATPLRGSLSDFDLLRAAAADADAVVHAAVDVSMTAQAQAAELDAVAALVQGAASSATAKRDMLPRTRIMLPESSSRPASTLLLSRPKSRWPTRWA